jgi:hypothetical protein
MAKKLLGILFLIGLGLVGIPILFMMSGGLKSLGTSYVTLVLPIGIGVFLMLLSGTKLLRKFDSYLDR